MTFNRTSDSSESSRSNNRGRLNTIWGSSANDTLEGGSGRDSLRGGAGADLIFGYQGSDYLEGGFGRDTLIGGVGIDWLSGGDGDDLLVGSAISNRVKPQSSERDYLVGGEGRDRFFLTAAPFGGRSRLYNLSGETDFAEIGAFDPREDSIILSGSRKDYSIINKPYEGTGELGESNLFYQGDLIAKAVESPLLNLNDNYFVFSD